jgi:glutathione S-transferase
LTDRHVTLFHAPNTRSTGTLILLEELAADYELKLLDFARQEQRSPDYLAVNPMGKVPAIHHAGAVVTEQVAIYIYSRICMPTAASCRARPRCNATSRLSTRGRQ